MANERTVLHGVDQSVPDAGTLPSKGNIASEAMTEDVLSKWIYDDATPAWLPMEYVAIRWDVATNGGDVAIHSLAATLPKDTIVWDGCYLVLDPLVSTGAATIRITTEAAGDV